MGEMAYGAPQVEPTEISCHSIDGAIFDCDGTLLDSIGAWLATQDELASRAGAVLTYEETTHVSALTLPETAAFFHERYGLGASSEEVLGMIDYFMAAHYQEDISARPGALEFVRMLHGRGIKCSVASSTSQPLLRIALTVTGFMPYLDAVVSVDDVGISKREPAVYDRACELMGTPKESTWVFEDSVYALNTLVKANYHTVGVYDRDISGTPEELSIADFVIQSFKDTTQKEFTTLFYGI